jgi:hypothetical protein
LHDGNKVADELAKLDSSQAMITPEVFIQELNKPSISRTLAKANKMPSGLRKLSHWPMINLSHPMS